MHRFQSDKTMDIKNIIKQKGYTMEQVAEKVGVTRATLAQNLSGNPTMRTLRRVADAIGCQVGDFFLDERSDGQDAHSIICPQCGAKLRFKAEESQK